VSSVVQAKDLRKHAGIDKTKVPRTKAEMRRELREAVENTVRMTLVQQEGDEYV
jgi:hypothetical protein